MRRIRRGLPATTVVIKVTECLNECAARLGVSLRQTEDQLTRDMLASTASFINCTAGVNGDNPTELTRADVDTVVEALVGNNAYTIMDNIEGEDRFGKLCAEVKSLLIDLETYVLMGYGNRAQA